MAKGNTLRSRIVGEGEEAPAELVLNPLNWRKHPQHQVDALEGLLNEVGWVQRVIVNRITGHVVDGHARVELAIRRGETMVPVVYVELSENEEKLVLAALDPIGGLATTDDAKLDELLREVKTGDPALMQLLDDLAKDAGIVPQEPPDEQDVNDTGKNLLVVELPTERDCEALFQELTDRGFSVKVME